MHTLFNFLQLSGNSNILYLPLITKCWWTEPICNSWWFLTSSWERHITWCTIHCSIQISCVIIHAANMWLDGFTLFVVECGLMSLVLFVVCHLKVYLYGGHVTSWKNEQGEELLFMSNKVLQILYNLILMQTWIYLGKIT